MDDGDSSGGSSTAGQHPVSTQRALYVAPTEGSTAYNTIRLPIVPVACWRLGDPAFDFDSSFVLPTFSGDATLSGIVRANTGCPAAIFAHADPAGSDELNKTISDRRAIAIYALLTRQPPLWEDLYATPVDGDRWGPRSIQAMLQTIVGRAADDDGNPLPPRSAYYAGSIDGKYGPETRGAVKQFQTDSGLADDGDAGPQTRKILFGAYMDMLCTPASPTANAAPVDPSSPPPSAPAPFQMKPSDFLGGTGAGAGDLPKVSLQGCSRFNPLVLLTSDEMNGTDKELRNAEDSPNRRVLLFFFPPGTTVEASKWPCPKVKDPMDACKSAFWSDGDARRQNGNARQEYATTRRTMACKFYDRFARLSPCEGAAVSLSVPFKISLAVGDDVPWTLQDSVVVLDAAGNVVFQSALQDGTALGSRRIFVFKNPKAGEQYSGEIRFGSSRFVLFGASKIDLKQASTSPVALATPANLYDSPDTRTA